MGAKIKTTSECEAKFGEDSSGTCNFVDEVAGVEFDSLKGLDKLDTFNLTQEEVVGNAVNR